MLSVKGLPAILLTVTLAHSAPIQVHGHRGARAILPENTIPAFEYAIAVGADVIELDMAVTKDNVVVVSHDPVLNPELCNGPGSPRPIRELTLAELREWECGSKQNPNFPKQLPVPGARIPTLDEVFELAARRKFDFNIETKIFADHPEYTPTPERFARLVLDAIRRHGLESRVIVQSFDFRTLAAMKQLAPQIRLAALYEKGEESFVEVAKRADAGIISPHYSLVTPEKVKAAHDAGLQIVPWTPNTAAEWAPMIEAGVNAIITDDPAALIAYLKEKKLR